MQVNDDTLNKAWIQVQQELEKFLHKSTLFQELKSIFGSDLDRSQLEQALFILEDWAKENSSQLPLFKISPAKDINNANAAYVPITNTIYLSAEFLAKNDLKTVSKIILEELGHALDRQLNVQDTPGDEGAIFAALIRGETISAQDLNTLKSEDDSAIVNLDGQEVQREQSSNFDPTGLEQEMLELINRMRANPAAELNLLLNSSDPNVNNALNAYKVNSNILASQWAALKPIAPLAWSSELSISARNHSRMMIDFDQQSHQLPTEASLTDRAINAGYKDYRRLGENIFAYGTSTFQAHAAFAIDWGNTSTGIQEPAGHRNTIMNAGFREIGIGIIEENNFNTTVGPFSVTQDFGDRFTLTNPWLLGVVFKDLDGDNFYDNGEGLGQVNVQIQGSKGTFSTQTMTAGGYQLELAPDNYTVTFSGGGLSQSITKNVTMAAENVKIDAKISSATPTLKQFLDNPLDYMGYIRDFDGNDLGRHDAWKSIGTIDIQGDGDLEYVFLNPVISRWATVGVDSLTGQINFTNNSWGGDTRIVGVYEDPLVKSGQVEKNGNFDSQRRFGQDLSLDNLTLISNSNRDYDGDGLQEIYFRVNDGTAVLHAYMHADGNIEYANYQSKADLAQFMNTNGIDSSLWNGWL